MIKKLLLSLTVLVIALIPFGVAQARLNNSELGKQEMINLMDKMMVGELDSSSQMMLSEILKNNSKDGKIMRSGKFGSMSFGHDSYYKSSGLYWAASIVHLVFGLLILLLLFLLNAVLYKKLMLMNGKKK